MRILKLISAVCAAALILVQCAEKEGEKYDEREQAAFDNWMKVNHDRPEVERQDNGMYIEWLSRGEGPRPVEDNYVRIDYKGYTLGGDMFSNRDSLTAVDEGTFSVYAHYVDKYALLNEETYKLTKGEFDALPLMKEGDSVRLYLPASLAYSTTSMSFGSGYEGWYNSTNNPKNSLSGQDIRPSLSRQPVIIDLALNEVVRDAKSREQQQVAAAAAAIGGFTQDTVGLFFRYVDDPDSDVSGEDEDSAVITKDSAFYMTYSLWFLDDFLVATNDPGTAQTAWGYTGKEYGPFYFKNSTLWLNDATGRYISAINKLIERGEIEVRYNSRMQLLFTSEWAYGDSGFGSSSNPGRPEIDPYTPLKIDIITLEYGYDPDPDDEEEESQE